MTVSMEEYNVLRAKYDDLLRERDQWRDMAKGTRDVALPPRDVARLVHVEEQRKAADDRADTRAIAMMAAELMAGQMGMSRADALDTARTLLRRAKDGS